ncbi:hypothetical protein LJR230_003103 [Trinickia sp. LjRoot230]|uniref:hypothetical protein n=1 Tax=Trinickia sp. LjRoot230 TaxID=3342288 RepID=UPI003ED10451
MTYCITGAKGGANEQPHPLAGQRGSTVQTAPEATCRARAGAELTELTGLPRRSFVKIEFTRGELNKRLKAILGPHAFDETEFGEMMHDLKGTPAQRERKLRLWAWKRLDPLPPNTLKMLGHGMDHAVYTDPDKPGKVVKISVASLSLLVKWSVLFPHIGAAMPKSIVAKGEALAKSENRRYAVLASYFPAKGSVPTQTAEIAPVSVRRAVAEFLMHNDVLPNAQRICPEIDRDVVEMPALVRTQDLLPQFDKPSILHFSLSMRYPEMLDKAPLPSLYAAGNDNWILNHPSTFNEEAFQYFVEGTKLEELYKACLSDSPKGRATRAAVEDFLTRGIDFMNDSREILDVGGDGNAIFDEGRYFLPDVLSTPDIEKGLDVAAQTLRRLHELASGQGGKPVGRREIGTLIFALNQIRAINSMAQALDIPKRVHLLPPEEASRQIDWSGILEALRRFLPKDDDSSENVRVLRPKPVLIPVFGDSPWRSRVA